MKKIIFFSFSLFIAHLLAWPAFASAQVTARSDFARPNIVLMFPDNLGIGEVSCYGGVRGVPTPNIDRIADEGIRFTNFNVEYSCVVSRIAMLTGRYAVRTGEGYAAGMTLWEVTIAEALRSIGYSTALFGKWHVGGSNWEGKAGEPSRRVKSYNLETRRTIDREAAEHGIAFMEKNVKEGKPFFFFYPMTQVHFPTLPHPDLAGTTGAGDMGDAMADVDHNVGLILEALERLGIEDNTLVIWCTDNGAEMRRPWRGSAGPWRGFYNSAMEGGIRTPCVIRWPGRIQPGRVSNDMVHEVDLFPTIAAAVGASEIVPDDRLIDGVNQLPFLEGTQAHSGRDNYMGWRPLGHHDPLSVPGS